MATRATAKICRGSSSSRSAYQHDRANDKTGGEQSMDRHRLLCQKVTEKDRNQRIDIGVGRYQRYGGDAQKPDVGDKSARADHAPIGEGECRPWRNSRHLEAAPFAADDS